MGGEKNACWPRFNIYLGSPPRGRGKVPFACMSLKPGLITPAWAGKSQHPEGSSTSCQDHPRVGGEKSQKSKKVKSSLGSPPRGRGKVFLLTSCHRRAGITPAWAGKSHPRTAARHLLEDHPRVGGEKTTDHPQGQAPGGSPPRGRGKVPGSASGHPAPRITPAWAGKRALCRRSISAPKDHPRVGGEKAKDAQPSGPRTGSPPRGRGKAERKETAMMLSRITPAWAGKSIILRLDVKGNRDHPRVGGEKTKKIP